MKKKLLISLIAIVYSIDTSIALAKSINPIAPAQFIESAANAVSDNGLIVIGKIKNKNKNIRGYIWNQDGGIELGTFRKDGSGNSELTGVSADGSIAVGFTNSDRGGGIDLRAFIWDKNNGMQDLGTLRSDGIGTSVAYGISRDGTIVVGAADAGGTSHAFKWHKDTGMIDLGSLTADNKGRSYARSVSSDGEYIVGASHNDIAPDIYQAFIWHKSTGMRDLGTLNGSTNIESDAYGISGDGSIVAGGAKNDKNEQRAFIWHSDTGMQDLGTLKSDNSGNSVAKSISESGLTIVGWALND